MNHRIALRTSLTLALTSATLLPAQQPTTNQPGTTTPRPPAPTKYTGCVTSVPTLDKTYVLASANRCFLLDSPTNAARLLNHTVTLQGLLEPAAGLNPDTLHVQAVLSLQNACSVTCTLVPPGSRGIHGNEKPGHEGATPGLVPTPPPTPPRP